MTLKSFLKRLILIEEKIEVLNSPVNGEIFVYEDLFGNKTMRIGKVSQSGELVDAIWKKAIKEIFNFKFLIFNQFLKGTNFKCLILGLGCGGVAKLINQKWPEAKMVGVDIDPMVVEVGKKYFGLSEIKNLKIEIADAIKAIFSPKYLTPASTAKRGELNTKYNLILVDLYLGQSFSKGAENEDFLNGIKNLLDNKGVAVFNRFYWNSKYRAQVGDFERKLRTFFPKVWSKKVNYNLLIFCSF